MNTYVLFHESCNDGTGAKYACWRQFKDQAKYISVQYDRPFPDDVVLDINTHIYIVDFSYPRNILENIRQQVGSLTVIDHHESAMEDLKDFPGVYFDMEHSGAVLTWKYFNPGVEVPYVLQLVEDRDIWRYDLPESKALAEVLSSDAIYNKMETWDLLAHSQKYLEEALHKGTILLQSKINKVNVFTKSSRPKYTISNILGHPFIIYNTTEHISDLAEAFYTDPKIGVDCTASYFIDAGGDMIISFRSAKDSKVNLSKLAKELGGGGHFHAAGCRIKFPESLKMLESFFVKR